MQIPNSIYTLTGKTIPGCIQLRIHRHFRIRNVRQSHIEGPRGWKRNISAQWLERHGRFSSVHFNG